MGFVPAFICFAGSTGLEVARRFASLARRVFGERFPDFWQVLLVETMDMRASLGGDFPQSWHFLPLDLAPELGKIAGRILNGQFSGVDPDILSQPTSFGGGQEAVRVAFAAYLQKETLMRTIQSAWDSLNDLAQMGEAARNFQVQLLGTPPLFVVVGSNAGATHNGTAPLLFRLSQELRPRPQWLWSWVIGPMAGHSSDYWRTEKANAAMFFAVLQEMVSEGVPVQCFWFDAPPGRREFLLAKVAEFLAFFVSEFGEEVRRQLFNAFAAANRNLSPGEPPRWLCRVNLNEWRAPAREVQRAIVLSLLSEIITNLTRGGMGDVIAGNVFGNPSPVR